MVILVIVAFIATTIAHEVAIPLSRASQTFCNGMSLRFDLLVSQGLFLPINYVRARKSPEEKLKILHELLLDPVLCQSFIVHLMIIYQSF